MFICIITSLTNTNMHDPGMFGGFIGLTNFANLFKDEVFLKGPVDALLQDARAGEHAVENAAVVVIHPLPHHRHGHGAGDHRQIEDAASKTSMSRALQRRENIAGYLFMLPSLIFFLGFVIIPMFICIITSLTNTNKGMSLVYSFMMALSAQMVERSVPSAELRTAK